MRRGERSTTAASVLERNGFADVQNLEGGIEAWRAAGQQVTV
jgi:rhodanese-related sulfurtransferase